MEKNKKSRKGRVERRGKRGKIRERGRRERVEGRGNRGRAGGRGNKRNKNLGTRRKINGKRRERKGK